jgi:hypothetical protein
LTIFAKGNLDVHDSLHSLRLDGKILWNGVNEIMRARFPGTLIRLRHETWTRSDALLACDGVVPVALTDRHLPLHPYSAPSQFSRALFEANADVVILSAQPDVMTTLVRHRSQHYLLYPHDGRSWPAADRLWLRNEFTTTAALDVDASMANLARIIERVRQRSAIPVLVYNIPSAVPGEWVHCHAGLDDILSTRIRRFDLGLAELSQRIGVSVIDVDRIVARAGADRVMLDALHLTAEGCRLVAEEVVRVLEDLGCLSRGDS